MPEPLPSFDPAQDAFSFQDYSPAGVERCLLGYRPPALAALGLPHDFVLPHDTLSIASLPATLAALLGTRLASGAAPPLPSRLWEDLASGVNCVVWVILDAVGWPHFADLITHGELPNFRSLAAAGRLLPLTSIFPSTTTSALTTLWTGHWPAQHGLVGHELYLQEFGEIVDTLGFSPIGEPRLGQMVSKGMDPESFVRVPGLAEALRLQGVSTRVLIQHSMAASAYSRLCFRGALEVIPFVNSSDMWTILRQVYCAGARDSLSQSSGQRRLIVAYWSDPDTIGHLRGPGSASWAAELRKLDFSLGREFLSPLSNKERRNAVVVVSADHGQEPGGAHSSVPVPDHPGVAEHLLLPPTGAPRAAYLFARCGHLETLKQAVDEQLGEHFVCLDPDTALHAGLLGPGAPVRETAIRLGDLIVIAKGDRLLDRRHRDRPLLGLHGGMTAREMLVPWLVARLD